MKNKDLIKDILQYIKENEEARERFNEISSNKINYCYSPFDKKKKLGEELYYKGFDIDFFDNYTKNDDKTLFIIHALSSPNGKPICGFLEEENAGEPYDIKEKRNVDGSIYDIEFKQKEANHAKTLRTIYLEALDEGKSHEEAYKLINDKYNEIL